MIFSLYQSCFFIFILALSRKRIGIMSMLGVYIVLAVGMIIAFMTLVAELYWKRKAKQALVDKLHRFVWFVCFGCSKLRFTACLIMIAAKIS